MPPDAGLSSGLVPWRPFPSPACGVTTEMTSLAQIFSFLLLSLLSFAGFPFPPFLERGGYVFYELLSVISLLAKFNFRLSCLFDFAFIFFYSVSLLSPCFYFPLPFLIYLLGLCSFLLSFIFSLYLFTIHPISLFIYLSHLLPLPYLHPPPPLSLSRILLIALIVHASAHAPPARAGAIELTHEMNSLAAPRISSSRKI